MPTAHRTDVSVPAGKVSRFCTYLGKAAPADFGALVSLHKELDSDADASRCYILKSLS